MFDRKKAGIVSVIGLSAAMITGVAVNAFADTKSSDLDNPQSQKVVPEAQVSAVPAHEQLADRLSQQLGLNDKTRNKVSDLFEKDSVTINKIQENLHKAQAELTSLSPNSKTYMDEVNDLADRRGELTKELTLAYAENRAQLYELLTPEQIGKLEAQTAAPQS